MHRRISLLIAAVAVLCLAVAVPTASAGPKLDKAQNKKLKSQSKAIKRNSANIKKGAGAVKKLDSSTTAAGNAIKALKVIADRADANAKTVLDAAPAIIKGLGDLKTGLEAAGAGLTSLKTLATSQEYGFSQVINSGSGAVGFVVTPDIPDSIQQAEVEQSFKATAAGNISAQFGVRSNESDGDGAVAAANCTTTITDLTTGTQSTPVAPPFTPVLTKSTLTSTVPANAGFPFGLKTVAPDADVTVAGPTPLAVALGDVFTVKLACVDITADAANPAA